MVTLSGGESINLEDALDAYGSEGATSARYARRFANGAYDVLRILARSNGNDGSNFYVREVRDSVYGLIIRLTIRCICYFFCVLLACASEN